MISRLDRYVFREMLVPLIAGTVITAFLFLANQLIGVFKDIDIANVPPEAIAKFIILTTPKWFKFTIPIGIALGAALAFSRLVRDGELTAMRSAGISIKRALLTVWVVGITFAGLFFYNAERVVPVAAKEELKLASELLIVAATPRFEQNMPLKLTPYVAIFGEVEQSEPNTLVLRDITLIERPRPGQRMIYLAESGMYKKGVWSFEKPHVWYFENEAFVEMRDAKRIVINQRIDIQEFMQGARPDDATADELWKRAEQARLAGDPNGARANLVNFYERFALPAACIIFGVMSAILAIRFSKGSPFQGLLVSFVAIWLFFNVHIIATTIIGKYGWLPPMIATWSPVAFYALVTVLVFRGLE